MAPASKQKYKIKLSSGRVLGPLDLRRIRAFIIKGQITGVELARAHPVGEWVDINEVGEIADFLVSHARGQLSAPQIKPVTQTHQLASQGTTRVLEPLEAHQSLPSISLPTGLKPLNMGTVPQGETIQEDEKTVVLQSTPLEKSRGSLEPPERDAGCENVDRTTMVPRLGLEVNPLAPGDRPVLGVAEQ